jgi:hypothetical protein
MIPARALLDSGATRGIPVASVRHSQRAVPWLGFLIQASVCGAVTFCASPHDKYLSLATIVAANLAPFGQNRVSGQF